MARPVTLFTGQWADLSFEEICRKAVDWGYDGLEIACWGDHMEVRKAAGDPAYVQAKKDMLEKHGLKCWALGAHLAGQCVGDRYDPRLDVFAPAEVQGKPEELRRWAVEEMKLTARAAQAMGCGVVNGFMGSPIWAFWYSFPPTTDEMVEEGFREIVRLWTPILDVFDECPTPAGGVRAPARPGLQFRSQPPAVAGYGAPSLHPGIPTPHLSCAHERCRRYLGWQVKHPGLSSAVRRPAAGLELPLPGTRGCEELNAIGYAGPLSVEWEDNGMDREFGVQESAEYVKSINFAPSDVAFDKDMKT